MTSHTDEHCANWALYCSLPDYSTDTGKYTHAVTATSLNLN